MNIHAEKTKENKSQSVASAVYQKKSSSGSTFQFVDNRPEAIVQRKLQEMANNSPQTKQAAQLQSMADNYTARQKSLIQKKGIENLSDSMNNVKVHFDSDKHTQLNAHASTIQLSTIAPIQRATVAGVRNDSKNATEIGTDMHGFITNRFLESNIRGMRLYREFSVGGGRADIVATVDEQDYDEIGEMTIYVGELKPEGINFYGRGVAASQLAVYIANMRTQYPGAHVAPLDFWNPPADGYTLGGDGYDCIVYVQNVGGGLYTYTGRKAPSARIEGRIEDSGVPAPMT